MSANAENAIQIQEMNAFIDSVGFARQIEIPTLVLHCAGDRVIPVSSGRRTARLISGAQFVELPGNDHVVLEGQPCFNLFFEEVRDFWRNMGQARILIQTPLAALWLSRCPQRVTCSRNHIPSMTAPLHLTPDIIW